VQTSINSAILTVLSNFEPLRIKTAKMKKTGRGHCCDTEMSDYVTPSVSETTKFNQCEKLKQCWKLETIKIKICYWMQYQDGSSSS